MADGQMSLEELADRVGLTRRALRFYVQRGLLPPPLGLGRGRHYDQRHLDVVRRIQELQAAGHSLDAIGRILAGGQVEEEPAAGGSSDIVPPSVSMSAAPSTPSSALRRRTALAAELWTRLQLLPGVELHFDATEHPSADQLLKIRQAVRRILRPDLLDDEETAEED
jgi:DNA-binding transcriptional MerR regulator